MRQYVMPTNASFLLSAGTRGVSGVVGLLGTGSLVVALGLAVSLIF